MSSISTYAGSASSGFVAGGTAAWSNTGNYTGTSDSTDATSAALGSGTVTQSLDAYNFNPGVPAGQTINGFQYVGLYLRGAITTRAEKINSHTLTINGSASSTPGSGVNGDNTVLGTTYTTVTWGGSTALWGLAAPSVATVNSAVEGTGPTFSVFIAGTGGTSGSAAHADSIQQTVWYSAGGGGGSGANQALTTLGCG